MLFLSFSDPMHCIGGILQFFYITVFSISDYFYILLGYIYLIGGGATQKAGRPLLNIEKLQF